MSDKTLGMSFFEVVQKLQTDKAFSNHFEGLANAIVRGINAPEWEAFLSIFAKDADELSQLMAAKPVLRNLVAVDRLNTVNTGIFTTGTAVCAEALLRDAGFAMPQSGGGEDAPKSKMGGEDVPKPKTGEEDVPKP